MSDMRAFWALTGGGTGALDKVVSTSLSNLDAAVVITANNAYFFSYDSSSTLGEDSPNVIRPDNNPASGRWILTGMPSMFGPNVQIVRPGGSIQDAIDAITDATAENPFTVLVCPGLYEISEPILAKSYVSVRSISRQGARIKVANGANIAPVWIGHPAQVVDIEFSGFSIDGNKDNQTSGSYHHGIKVVDAENITLKNNYITKTHPYHEHSTGGSGISVTHNCSEIYILDNVFEDIGDRAIQFGGTDITVKGNSTTSGFDRSCSCEMQDDYGNKRYAERVLIVNNFFEGSAEGSAMGVNGVNRDITIEGNITTGNSLGGVRLWDLDTTEVRNILIEGNHFIDENYGITTREEEDFVPLDSGTATSGSSTMLQDTSKSWTGKEWRGDALLLTGGTGSGQMRRIQNNNANTIWVSDDEDWTTNPDGTTTYDIRSMASIGLSIKNNKFSGNTNAAIRLLGINADITGNTFLDCGQNAITIEHCSVNIQNNTFQASQKGTIVASYCYDMLISGNKKFNTGTGTGWSFCKFEGCRYNKITDNVIVGEDEFAKLDSEESGGYPSAYNFITDNTGMWLNDSVDFVDERDSVVKDNVIFPATTSYDNDPDSTSLVQDNKGFPSETQRGKTATLSDHGTFTSDDGKIHSVDPGGAARNYNPSGEFKDWYEIVVINTADAAETITFDSTDLSEAIAQNERGIFVYDGTNWLKVYVGS